jgi:acyl-coenzyme A thioesterase PaaI-like protein
MRAPAGTADRTEFHRDCFACGARNAAGLRLRFNTSGTTATGTVVIDARFRGYEGTAQGGVIATILDAAMVRLLHDLSGEDPLTGRLEVRYLSPTPVLKLVAVSAKITKARGRLYQAVATLREGSRRCATARGTFKVVPMKSH